MDKLLLNSSILEMANKAPDAKEIGLIGLGLSHGLVTQAKERNTYYVSVHNAQKRRVLGYDIATPKGTLVRDNYQAMKVHLCVNDQSSWD